ncbi:DeoR/GlpR family DNA-binding transcription regulator [Donghicola tyrosinivorans]|uniref:DeoR/GlpR family transcriptional regulator of sugar metabolism n=1 Tax=Donghicola tyrosinivorans TaxID=1652492 RepID=A0A2T0WFG7_9RHOB|nr:DeoR/GlpR family DNA-binding transcription regulator [Donghicola tyrosinivorans]PRY85416.1 DeoR/GlpR family transcriptional regulator of sugar metabolism [Donghicola tyrosinivorans]
MTKNTPQSEPAFDRLMAEKMPADSRQARQLARRKMITEAVMAEGTMRIEDLTDKFGISLMTVHRDLDELVSLGLLRKTRGIVSAAPTNLIESSDIYRSSRQVAEKRAIAQKAMEFIEPGQAVFLDDSTTVWQMVHLLEQKTPLTVLTNSLLMINELKEVREIALIALGGQFFNWCNAFMGRMTRSQIAEVRADTFFVSMSAIANDVVYHQSPEMVETKRAMMASSERSILLADHTKFDQRALHSFASLTEFDTVIVDDNTTPEHIERMRDKGINVEIAKTE